MEKDMSVSLPIECISAIASYLEYRDRANLEMVSHIWRLGSLNSHRTSKVLNLNDKVWSDRRGRPIKMLDKMLEWLLKRCGNKSVAIKLEQKVKTKSLTPQAIDVITEYCPNIEHLHLEGTQLEPCTVFQIAMCVSRLRSLSIDQWEYQDERWTSFKTNTALVNLLHNNVLLESLKIAGRGISMQNTLGEFFLHLPPTLRQLDITDYHGLDLSYLGEAIGQFKQLESLKINFYCRHLTDILSALVKNDALRSTFTNLQLLYSCSVTSSTILYIGTHMTQIENLDISGCKDIRGKFALEPLGKLTKLKSLAMSRLYKDVGAGFLKSLSNLSSLECVGNRGVVDEDICDLLCHAYFLVDVNIEKCTNLTRKVIHTVLELRKTPRRVPLDIYLYDTKIYPGKEAQMDSNIRIHYKKKVIFDYFDFYEPF